MESGWLLRQAGWKEKDTMNTDLAKQIADIVELGTYWDEDVWMDFPDNIEFLTKEEDKPLEYPYTTACVAGHAAWLYAPIGSVFSRSFVYPNESKTFKEPVNYKDYGAAALDLTICEAAYLFDMDRDKDEILDFLRADDSGQKSIIDLWHWEYFCPECD